MRSTTSGFLCKSAVVAAVAALAWPNPGLAAGQTTMVSGDSAPSECGAAKKADYSSELTGSLVGCWATFVGHVNCQELNGFALWTEIGREEFEGKLDDVATKFDTQYTFTGLFPSGTCPKPAPENEVVGGCIHYLSGEQLVGTVRFYDVMFGDHAPHYFYEGTISTY